jgi:hypothetical protein
LMRIGYLRIKAYITKEETNVDAAAVWVVPAVSLRMWRADSWGNHNGFCRRPRLLMCFVSSQLPLKDSKEHTTKV